MLMAAEGNTSMDADVADAPVGTPVGSSSMTSDDSTPVMSDSSEAEDGDLVGTDSDDEGTPLEEFAPDEQELADTTRRQHYEEGRDLQGIPWERLQVSRAEYRQQRVQRYRNYMNCIPEDDCPAVRAELTAGWRQPAVLADAQWSYAFLRNWRAVASSIVHFQLRNLLWAPSAHDVAVVFENRVQHWNCVTRRVSDVLDLRGCPKGPRLPGLSRVQVSTLCVDDGLVAAGGFSGELVLATMKHTQHGPAWDDDDGDDEAALTQQQQQQDDSLDAVPDVEQQQQEQQELLIQQRLQTAAKQLYPGAAVQEWQQQQWPALRWPLPPSPPPQQQSGGALWQQQRQQQQQAGGGAAARPSSSLQHIQQHWRASQTQHQQPQQQQQLHRQQYSSHAVLQQQQQHPCEPLLGAAGPSAARVLHCCRVTQSENGITNGIEIFDSCNYGHCVMTSNNDCCVRLFDVEGCRPRQRLPFSFAVNYATLRPAGAAPGGGAVAAVVGDDPLTWLVDLRSGLQLMQLGGHRDFSFAAAWHPQGHLLATGNQDSTTRVWDLRSPSEPLAVLGGTMGAIRSLRFSPDGAFLAAAEPADFVHVYNVGSGFGSVQEIDLFGEVAGIAFSPDSQAFFVCISDTLYNSLVQYQRVGC